MATPARLASVLLLHGLRLMRVLVPSLVEILLSLTDCVRGVIARHNLFRELTFVPARVAVCVVLSELTVIGATADLARGVPIMHVNLLGYDEQAHRRGPRIDQAREIASQLDMDHHFHPAWQVEDEHYDAAVLSQV